MRPNRHPYALSRRFFAGFSLLVAWQLAWISNTKASSVPDWYRKQAKDQPAFAELLADPLAYDGRVVILGGTVVGAKNTQGVFSLQIVEQPLSKGWGSYRPKKEEMSAGCFYAIVPGFVDHSNFNRGTQMTIAGTIKGAEPGRLGEQSSLFPVVRASWMRVWNAPRKKDSQDRTTAAAMGSGMGGMGMYGPMGMGGMGMYGPMGMGMGMGPWY